MTAARAPPSRLPGACLKNYGFRLKRRNAPDNFNPTATVQAGKDIENFYNSKWRIEFTAPFGDYPFLNNAQRKAAAFKIYFTPCLLIVNRSESGKNWVKRENGVPLCPTQKRFFAKHESFYTRQSYLNRKSFSVRFVEYLFGILYFYGILS
jgi:hypothetical protein